MTLTTQLIPPDRQDSFFTVRFYYKSTASSTQGILSHVLKALPNEYAIWEMTNHTLQRLELGEDGSTFLLIEDRDKGRQRPAIAAQEILDDISLDPKMGRLLDPQAHTVTAATIKNRIQDLWQQGASRNDVFLSYDHDDEEHAEMINDALHNYQQRVYMARRELHAGDKYRERIREAIANSREVCILITPRVKNSSWVMMEYGIALAYDKHIAPIKKCSEQDVPEVFRNIRHFAEFNDLDSYVNGVLKRKRQNNEGAMGV